MPDFASPVFLAALATTLVAGVVRGFAGFGAAMIMTPVFSALHGPLVGVPLCLILEWAVSFPLLPGAVALVDWRRVGTLLAAAACAAPLGVWLLATADPAAMRWAISGVVLAAVVALAAGWRRRGHAGLPATLAAGSASGVLNGAFGMAGPPIALFYLSGEDDAATVRASLIVYFSAIDLVSLCLLAANGILTVEIGVQSLALLPAVILGGLLGKLLFGRASERFYRTLALVLLAAVAAGSLAFGGG